MVDPKKNREELWLRQRTFFTSLYSGRVESLEAGSTSQNFLYTLDSIGKVVVFCYRNWSLYRIKIQEVQSL